jgi:DNA topoisomerase-2
VLCKDRRIEAFYSEQEYHTWKNDRPNDFKVKYYKGLATHSEEEAREYFSNADQHRKSFVWTGDQDQEAITLAYNEEETAYRKELVLKFLVCFEVFSKSKLINSIAR